MAILDANGQPAEDPIFLDEKECFESFTKLAGRVTHLRTILQEPELIKRKEAEAWAEDVRSVVQDFVVLTNKTREHVLRRMEKENAPASLP